MKRIWLIGSLFLLSFFLISCSSNTALKVPENAEVDRIVATPAASGNPELSVTGKQITDADEIARMLDALREMKTTDEEKVATMVLPLFCVFIMRTRLWRNIVFQKILILFKTERNISGFRREKLLLSQYISNRLR